METEKSKLSNKNTSVYSFDKENPSYLPCGEGEKGIPWRKKRSKPSRTRCGGAGVITYKKGEQCCDDKTVSNQEGHKNKPRRTTRKTRTGGLG